jgi:hypothetical protein
MMQKAYVSHGEKMEQDGKKGRVTVRSSSIDIGRVVRGAMLSLMEKIK